MITYEVAYDDLKTLNVANFLLVTVTPIETENLLEKLGPISKNGVLKTTVDGKTYHIGRMGCYNVIHCQCMDQGATSSGGSIVTIMNAFEHWSCIKAVIMVGIAFGMYDEPNASRQQHIGDILIAKDVIPYERQKVQPREIQYKEDRQSANPDILDAFKIVEADWNEKNLYDEQTGMEICDLLSGEKLVNNLDYRNQLKEKFKSSRGGEMEGAGVASACVNKNIPWVVMKSICDFGDGYKQLHKYARQSCAAALAAEACRRVLSKAHSLDYLCDDEKSNYYYQFVDENKMLQIGENVIKVFDEGVIIAPVDQEERLLNITSFYEPAQENFAYYENALSESQSVFKDDNECNCTSIEVVARGTNGNNRTYVRFYRDGLYNDYGFGTITYYMKIRPYKRTLGVWYWCNRSIHYNIDYVLTNDFGGMPFGKLYGDYNGSCIEKQIKQYNMFIYNALYIQLSGYASTPDARCDVSCWVD